jgi:hypothetical protein
MRKDELPWIELGISRNGEDVSVRARGSGGEEAPPRKLSLDFAALAAFGGTVRRAAESHMEVEPRVRARARELWDDVFQGGVLELFARYRERAGGAPLLVRLAIDDPGLQALPWEVMCQPGTQEGFFATSADVRVARKVQSLEPLVPREILGSVRILVLAPAGAGVVAAIRMALADAIESGAVELAPPIERPFTDPAQLRKALLAHGGRDRSPHIVHVVAHGALEGAGPEQKPVLAFAGEPEDVALPVESFAQDLAEIFGETLRLVVLDSCRSASPGAVGSAAEILARRAAGAVIAHLFTVRAAVAAAYARSLYTSLTLWDQQSGDVAASLHGARRELLRGVNDLEGGAGAFSAVLYLRGVRTALFDFPKNRRPRRIGASTSAADALVPSPLRALVGGRFSLLFGDDGEDPLDGQRALRRTIAQRLGVPEEAERSLAEAGQRYALVEGRVALDGVFKEVLDELLEEDEAPITPLAESLADVLGPGVHTTLLWLPVLEHALAKRYPDKRIYVVQPPPPGGRSPWVRLREAGASKWKKLDRLPDDARFDADFVVLRPYGGISAEEGRDGGAPDGGRFHQECAARGHAALVERARARDAEMAGAPRRGAGARVAAPVDDAALDGSIAARERGRAAA